MDPQHDKFVEKAIIKYTFKDMCQMKYVETVPLCKGILDEQSAKKILGP